NPPFKQLVSRHARDRDTQAEHGGQERLPDGREELTLLNLAAARGRRVKLVDHEIERPQKAEERADLGQRRQHTQPPFQVSQNRVHLPPQDILANRLGLVALQQIDRRQLRERAPFLAELYRACPRLLLDQRS